MTAAVRVPRQIALRRFSRLATKNGWQISETKMLMCLAARAKKDGAHLAQYLFFTGMPLRGGKQMGIVDVGNFDSECEVAYRNVGLVSKKQGQWDVDLETLVKPAVFRK
jgi:hypothetical protein